MPLKIFFLSFRREEKSYAVKDFFLSFRREEKSYAVKDFSSRRNDKA
jgi:hypothetical protein